MSSIFNISAPNKVVFEFLRNNSKNNVSKYLSKTGFPSTYKEKADEVWYLLLCPQESSFEELNEELLSSKALGVQFGCSFCMLLRRADGRLDAKLVETEVGKNDGIPDGKALGIPLGIVDGTPLGAFDGTNVETPLGTKLGTKFDNTAGCALGMLLRITDGTADGTPLGPIERVLDCKLF